MIKVSVIVPVYNIRNFVAGCVRSLLSQTMQEGVEYIIVDDASSDGSYDIVTGLVDGKQNFKVIRHELNQGLPAARNTGLAAASGEYVIHCDGDDFLEPTMVEKLYECAVRTGADMVWSDWYLCFSGNERYMTQPGFRTGKETVEGLLRGSMKYNVWNKLSRRSLYDGISFPAGRSMGEDMTMIKVAAKAKVTAHVPEALYHYRRTNTEALTQKYSPRKFEEIKTNTLDTVSFLRENSSVTETDIKRFLLNVKLPFLFTGKREDIRRWRRWFTEADNEILGNTSQTARVRFLQWCALKKLDLINILYFNLVQKVVYGKIYK